MKTKIAAVVLAAVLLLHVGGEFTRAKATGAAVAGVAAIGILAFNLLGVMSGRYDDTAEGISCIIENGVDGWQKAFVGTDDTPSWFASGWQQIYDTCSSWFDSGEITIDDNGKVRLKYSQYLELCGLIGNAYAETSLEIHSDIPYIMFKADPDIFYYLDPSIMISTEDNQTIAYAPVFYSEDKIYFSGTYITYSMSHGDNNGFIFPYVYLHIGSYDFSSNSYGSNTTVMSGAYTRVAYSDFFSVWKPCFSGGLQEICAKYYNANFNTEQSYSQLTTWYSYDGDTLSPCSSSEITDSGAKMAMINCKGEYPSFIKSIADYTVSATAADVDDLSDPLSTVLDKTTDPTLEIDTDPSIVSPDDAINITDIPGEADVTLSQLKEKTRVDIDIPSLIVDKFPFCIPFDFIRIISVFCAEPKAPVFRIPISTDLANLEPFEGNQTIGDIPEDFEPMFEIDEEIVIDLSCIPLVQPICYTIFILGFVILLIYITPKMINH